MPSLNNADDRLQAAWRCFDLFNQLSEEEQSLEANKLTAEILHVVLCLGLFDCLKGLLPLAERLVCGEASLGDQMAKCEPHIAG